jgi:uncharacterized membrane protein
MPDTHENRANSAALSISYFGLLWLGLAAVYLAASTGGQRGVALGAVGLMAGALLASSGKRVAGLLAGLALASACIYWQDSTILFAYVPPIAAFAFMAFFFHRTLRLDAEPIITRIARKEHPVLPMEIVRYTRTLTWMWALCFMLLLLVAVLLAPVLTLGAWARWVQGLGYAVPAILFLGEYIYRLRRFREYRHGSIPVLVLNTVAVIKEAAVKPYVRDSLDRG